MIVFNLCPSGNYDLNCGDSQEAHSRTSHFCGPHLDRFLSKLGDECTNEGKISFTYLAWYKVWILFHQFVGKTPAVGKGWGGCTW